MALNVERVVNRCLGGAESQGCGLRFEPLLLAFSSPDRQVGVLRPSVLSKPAWSMNVTQIQLVYRMAGGIDYLLRICVADRAAYNAFYPDLIEAVPSGT